MGGIDPLQKPPMYIRRVLYPPVESGVVACQMAAARPGGLLQLIRSCFYLIFVQLLNSPKTQQFNEAKLNKSIRLKVHQVLVLGRKGVEVEVEVHRK